jgi:hypothetical protein
MQLNSLDKCSQNGLKNFISEKEVRNMKRMLALTLALAFVLVFAVQAMAKDMEGEVTAMGKGSITVGKLALDAGHVDLSGIAVGDTVKVTYAEEGHKHVLKSISKVEEEMFMEGC